MTLQRAGLLNNLRVAHRRGAQWGSGPHKKRAAQTCTHKHACMHMSVLPYKAKRLIPLLPERVEDAVFRSELLLPGWMREACVPRWLGAGATYDKFNVLNMQGPRAQSLKLQPKGVYEGTGGPCLAPDG